MSFGKRFTFPKMRIFGESAGFEIKANAFNIFNKLNLAPFGFNSPSTLVGTGDLSTTGGVTTYQTAANTNFGRATGALGGRVIEFLGRFTF